MLLAQTGKTQMNIAARIGCSQGVVAHWLAGNRTPRMDFRVSLKRFYKIPIEAWDQVIARPAPATKRRALEPEPELAPAPPEVDDASATYGEFSVRARALKLDATIQQKLETIENDPHITALEWFKCAQTALAQLERLGKLTGQTQEVNEAKILRLPAWARIQEALLRVLADWPDALRKVGEELQRMGSES